MAGANKAGINIMIFIIILAKIVCNTMLYIIFRLTDKIYQTRLRAKSVYFSVASKPIHIRWIRTGSQPY